MEICRVEARSTSFFCSPAFAPGCRRPRGDTPRGSPLKLKPPYFRASRFAESRDVAAPPKATRSRPRFARPATLRRFRAEALRAPSVRKGSGREAFGFAHGYISERSSDNFTCGAVMVRKFRADVREALRTGAIGVISHEGNSRHRLRHPQNAGVSALDRNRRARRGIHDQTRCLPVRRETVDVASAIRYSKHRRRLAVVADHASRKQAVDPADTTHLRPRLYNNPTHKHHLRRILAYFTGKSHDFAFTAT